MTSSMCSPLILKRILIALALWIVAGHAFGGTYYVSPTGSDSQIGTQAQPWQTIQKAAETLVAGDTVQVRTGIYTERVIPKHSGSVDGYIVYAVYPGDVATIDGQGISLPPYLSGLFEISEIHHIKISGFRIINAGPDINSAGLLIEDANHIVVEGNYTHNTVSSGIGVWNSNHIVIDGNEVELACNDGEQECISVAETDSFEVRHNYVHHNGPGNLGGEGICTKDGSSNGKVFGNRVSHLKYRLGIYVDAWDKHTHDIDVYQNVVHNISGADGFVLASESGGVLEKVRIFNNIAYKNELSGMVISVNGDSLIHPMKNIQIINNTFYANGSEAWGGGISVENPDIENVIIKNNICSQNVWFQITVEKIVPSAELIVAYNLIDEYRGELAEEIYGQEYVEGDPRFVNPSLADFQLGEDSSCIDRGSSTDIIAIDFNGLARPQGNGFDIGAYEFPVQLQSSRGSDFNDDGEVNFSDFVQFAGHFGKKEGDLGFDAVYDLNNDGSVNFPDFLQFVQDFGG